MAPGDVAARRFVLVFDGEAAAQLEDDVVGGALELGRRAGRQQGENRDGAESARGAHVRD